MKDNFIKTFLAFLKILKIKVTRSGASKYLEHHPENGSMWAYSAALDHFNVSNAAAQLEQDEIKGLPAPYITFLHEDGGYFSVVRTVNDKSVTYRDSKGSWVKSSWEDYLSLTNGIVLLAEPDLVSGEHDYSRKKRMERLKSARLPLALIIIIGLVFLQIANHPLIEFDAWALFGIKILGMVWSVLLLAKSLNLKNTWVNRLCTLNAKSDCQSILDSPAAQINSWLSWSDLGFLYFFGSFFAFLFAGSKPQLWSQLVLIQVIFTGFGMTFSLYSLYYQGIRAKIWCPLCLGVLATIWMEAAWVYTYLVIPVFPLNSELLVPVISGFSIPAAFLLLYKKTASSALESDRLSVELSRLKSNPGIIKPLLEQQKPMRDIPGAMPRVLLGSNTARHVITMVSNPLCSPCARMHNKIEKLIREHPQFACQVVFLSNPDSEDPGGRFVRKLLSLPEEMQETALHLWFKNNDKNYERWNESFKVFNEKPGLQEVQLQHNQWAEAADALQTPTLFLNSRRLPGELTVEDLALHLEYIEPVTATSDLQIT